MAIAKIIYTTSAKLNTIAVKDGQIIFVKDSKLLYVDMDTTRVNINAGTVGATGATGATGNQGATGPQGPAASIAIGTVTTGSAGGTASVSNAGSTSAAKFNFTIPRGATGNTGAKGDTGATGDAGSNGTNGTNATISVGTVTTGAVGSNAVVSISSGKLNFTLPKGATGSKGPTGDKGNAGSNGANGTNASITIGTVTTGTAGTNAVITNAGNTTAAKYNFTIPRGATGDTGPKGDKGATGNKGPAGRCDPLDLNFNTYKLTNGSQYVNLHVLDCDGVDVFSMYLDLGNCPIYNSGDHYIEFWYDGPNILYDCAYNYGSCNRFFKSGFLATLNSEGEYYIRATEDNIYIMITCREGSSLPTGYLFCL